MRPDELETNQPKVASLTDEHKFLRDPSIKELVDRVVQGELCLHIGGLYGSSKALVVSALFKTIDRPVVIVCPDAAEAEEMSRDLCFFLGDEAVILLPPWDILATEILMTQKDVELRRIKAFSRLLSKKPVIAVIPTGSLLQRVPPKNIVRDYHETLAIGDTIDRDHLAEKLVQGGYRRTPLVEDEGEFSFRGNVIDIYPPTVNEPFRMLFMGDELESIRRFDPVSQRSGDEIIEFILPPARELILTEAVRERALINLRERANELGLTKVAKDRLAGMLLDETNLAANPHFLPLFYEENSTGEGDPDRAVLDTLFDYFQEESVLVYDDPAGFEKAAQKLLVETDHFIEKATKEEKFYLEKPSFCLTPDDVRILSKPLQTIHIDRLDIGTEASGERGAIRFETENHFGLRQETAPHPSKDESILAPLVNHIREWIRKGFLVSYLCAGEEEIQRMDHLFSSHDLPLLRSDEPFLSDLARKDDPGRLILKTGKIAEGFNFPGLGLILVGEEEIFGKKIRRRRVKSTREGYFLRSFGELQDGDFVVHTDHGIGLYRGLKRLTIGKIENDFLLVEYQDGDRLYIPVDRLNQLQRYIGPDGHVPKTDKLGGTAWENVKKRVNKAVHEVAEELVSLYAAREILEGHAYSAPDRYYEEFSSSFDYEETPDQAKAIEDVILDMGDSKPMDRLICGDAGFGKTEVAVRAAFRAAMDGKQTALLVPTTILAEQHYQTFSRRLAGYPLRVEVLNRFRNREQQKRIIEDIKKGSVDIVVGTHRLLQKDVIFKDLGLVIIDEEQRFGVTHKEKLKKLRTLVDVLTLTATPIPRTLQLSLIGIRDLSIINTPPEGRQAIKTYVLEFDEETIRDAVRQELDRGGQIFFLHNRVKSIYTVARLIERLVPECRIGIAHGQMKATELEDVMVKFLKKEYDLLICTTIIGSGVDVPTANTIIVNRADHFGLSALYQIRGRVGRSKEEARAYLLIPRGATLSQDAQKRLQVLRTFTDPGSGFKIASHDLEIRGAGNLVGMSQSGHISAVGYEMYTQLMEKAVRELRGEGGGEEIVRPEIHLGLPAFIPDNYIADMHQRLVTYKRISLASTDEDIAEIRNELMDLYGFVPSEVEYLLQVIRIRRHLIEVMGEKMEYDGENFLIAFHKKSTIDPGKIVNLSRKKLKGLRFTPDYRLYVPLPGLNGDQIIRGANSLLEAFIQ